MASEAYLIGRAHGSHEKLAELIVQRIRGHLVAQSYVMISYNVSRDLLPTVVKVSEHP